ncbi:hypothetical protein [Chitinophaga solisilvae]|uniref:hypothetical protein n=1 Tax=Chitinophaga solisilvae TaxID=1233460 RepID=UPI00137140C8|nr:hypothetical protein [Chitinophaga solisilvae]
MKQRLFPFALLLIIVAAMGCNRPSPEKTNPAATITTNDCGQATDSVNRVMASWSVAQEDMAAYEKLCKSHGEEIPVKGYTIRAVDLLAAMGMPPELADSPDCRFKHIRVYIGYRKKMGFKLYISPVDGACLKGSDPSKWQAGMDVLLDKHANPVPAGIDTPRLTSLNTYVLDLNAPCPKTCPEPPLQFR